MNLEQGKALGIFAVGYLNCPVGGIILASIGDPIGRKRMFAFMLAVPTVVIGLPPGYAQIGLTAPLQLLLCRVMQGLSIDGELPVALVFVAESIPLRHLACGNLATGSLLGAASVACFSGCVSMPSVLLISSFPAQRRYTGVAVSYNFATAIFCVLAVLGRARALQVPQINQFLL